jgi:ribosomal protein S18 acetylase RimI-like enzyme
VEALEAEARLIGLTTIVLETGTRLAAAIKLYEAMGYARIPLYGEYVASPDTSLCFGKSLG